MHTFRPILLLIRLGTICLFYGRLYESFIVVLSSIADSPGRLPAKSCLAGHKAVKE